VRGSPEIGEEDLIRREVCPVCDGDIGSEIAEGKLLYDRCADCSLIFMNPMPTQRWYDRAYERRFWERKAERFADHRDHVAQRLRKENVRGARLAAALQRWSAMPSPGQRILEVGCGYGGVATTLAAHGGAEAYGIEPGGDAAAVAEAIGVTICGRSLDEVPADARGFDLVVLSHVLEHAVEPWEMLSAVTEQLADGGLILIEVPNAYILPGIQLFHPYAFTTRALTTLLATCGLEASTTTHGGRFGLIRRRYLVAGARPADGPEPHGLARGLWFGYRWGLLCARPPLGPLDRFLARRLWPPDERMVAGWLEAASER